MKNKNLIFLVLGLSITAGCILVDRYLTPINDTLAIVLYLAAVILLITYIVRNKRSRKTTNAKM